MTTNRRNAPAHRIILTCIALVAAGLVGTGGCLAGETSGCDERWLVLGPFAWERGGTSPQQIDYLADDGGEATADPKAGEKAAGKAWQEIQVVDGRLDFNKHFGYREHHVAYAARVIESDAPSRRFLRIRHDDSASAWLNGRKLGTWGIGSRRLPIDLKKGRNVLVVKVDNGASTWDLFTELSSPVTFSTPVVTPNDDGVNDTARIRLALSEPTKAGIRVLDAAGRTVAAPLRSQTVQPQQWHAEWDGCDRTGRPLPDGTYTVRATLEGGMRMDGEITLRRGGKLRRHDYPDAKAFFPLGVFYISARAHDPDAFARDCKDIRAHGLNTIAFTQSPGFDTDRFTADGQNWLLSTLQAHDLRTIAGVGKAHGFLEDATPPTETNALAAAKIMHKTAAAWGDTVLAYYTKDEPPIGEVHKLNVLSRALEHVDADRPPVACLIGLDRIKAAYERYDGPIMYIDPYAVSHDSQPGDFRMKGFGLPDMDFTEYVDYARNTARPDARLWTIIQTHNFQQQLRQPTPAEVRAMSWLAVAHGSTGLIYFIYQTEQGWRGLIDEGRETERYKVVAEVASRIAPIARTLTALRYSDTSSLAALPDQTDTGTLVAEDGTTYVVVVNRNVEAKRTLTFTLRRAPEVVQDIARDAQPTLKGKALTVELDPGEGTVIRLGGKR